MPRWYTIVHTVIHVCTIQTSNQVLNTYCIRRLLPSRLRWLLCCDEWLWRFWDCLGLRRTLLWRVAVTVVRLVRLSRVIRVLQIKLRFKPKACNSMAEPVDENWNRETFFKLGKWLSFNSSTQKHIMVNRMSSKYGNYNLNDKVIIYTVNPRYIDTLFIDIHVYRRQWACPNYEGHVSSLN